MVRLVPIRGGEVPRSLVLIREGSNTLSSEALGRACEVARATLGIQGFSVLELPDGGYDALARLRPLLVRRRKVMVASGIALIEMGFALLPTLDYPHWTVVVAEPSEATFDRVRTVFSDPIDNPAYGWKEA